MVKSPDAFRTISEVAEELDLPPHVLRFWETRFSYIKPLKRGGGRRYYRPDDVDLLRGVRFFLYEEGYTIKGVQKIFREQGPRYISDIGRGDVDPHTEDSSHLPSVAHEGTEIDEFTHLHRLDVTNVTTNVQTEDQVEDSDFADNLLIRRAPNPSQSNLPASDVKALQATLFELLECKRRLDSAR